MKDDELLDLVNEKDEVVGTVWKSEAHKDPTKIHREIAIAVFNDKGETLIQQRSKFKSSPLSWKISAAGHVGAGEDPEVAVKREVFEELGIIIDPVFYKKVLKKGEKNGVSSESKFYYVYWAVVNGLPDLNLDSKEVADVKWVLPSNLFEFSKINDWDVNGLSHKIIMEIKEMLTSND